MNDKAKKKNEIVAAPVVAPVPWTPEELEFLKGLRLVGDQFSGFWQPEPGERLLGTYRGAQEVKGNQAHKIQVAFPTWVYSQGQDGKADRVQAAGGSVVLVWEHYQLRDLEKVEVGSRVVIQRGAERDIGNGKRVIEYTINAERLKEESGAASGSDPDPF
jgi:hypothetical protein